MGSGEEVGIDHQSEVERLARRAAAIQIEAQAALPLLALAQQIEMATNLKPVLIIPKGSPLVEVEKFYGYDVVGADVDWPYAAIPVPKPST